MRLSAARPSSPMVRFPDPRSRPPYHMHDMIHAQPETVRETIDRVERERGSMLGRPRGLIVTGCGTSFHAALYGAAILQEAYGLRVPVRAVPAYDLLHGVTVPVGTTVLAVSHSGRTRTTNEALRHVRNAGVPTIGMCGISDSTMESLAERTLVLGSARDASWANTMSYTSQLAAFACLATGVAARRLGPIEESLGVLPDLLRKGLGCEAAIRQIARSVVKRDRVTFVGSGLDAITVLEAALKIRETCGHPASGYDPEQLLHGPFLSLDRREAVVALVSRDDGAREREILRSLKLVGARVSTVGEASDVDVRLPRVLRPLRPILSILPLQFLAYHAALAKKANPDVMRSDRRPYARALRPMFR